MIPPMIGLPNTTIELHNPVSPDRTVGENDLQDSLMHQLMEHQPSEVRIPFLQLHRHKHLLELCYELQLMNITTNKKNVKIISTTNPLIILFPINSLGPPWAPQNTFFQFLETMLVRLV